MLHHGIHSRATDLTSAAMFLVAVPASGGAATARTTCCRRKVAAAGMTVARRAGCVWGGGMAWCYSSYFALSAQRTLLRQRWRKQKTLRFCAKLGLQTSAHTAPKQLRTAGTR